VPVGCWIAEQQTGAGLGRFEQGGADRPRGSEIRSQVRIASSPCPASGAGLSSRRWGWLGEQNVCLGSSGRNERVSMDRPPSTPLNRAMCQRLRAAECPGWPAPAHAGRRFGVSGLVIGRMARIAPPPADWGRCVFVEIEPAAKRARPSSERCMTCSSPPPGRPWGPSGRQVVKHSGSDNLAA